MNTNTNNNDKNYNLEDAENLDQYMEFVDKSAIAAMAALLSNPSNQQNMSSYDVAQKAYKIAKQMAMHRQNVINSKLMEFTKLDDEEWKSYLSSFNEMGN